MSAQQAAARTIRPTPTMVAALTAKQLSEVLLALRGRYSPGRVEAGRRFREKFNRATDDSMKSCLSDGGAGAVPEDAPCSHAARSHARFEIEGVQRHMQSSAGLASGVLLFERLVAVVGRGETVRQLAGGDGHKADALVVELGFALDLAGVYLGAIRS